MMAPKEPSQSRKEILVVDDSPVQATLLRRFLTQQGYTVSIAKHGADGLEKLRKQRVGLVISDIEMPVMNGYDLCVAIKRDAQLQNIPVLLLTTLTDPKDLMRGLNAGADSYLTKPYDEPLLLSRVQTLIGVDHFPKSEGEAAVVFAGDSYRITATRQHILNLLLSTYESARQQNQALMKAQQEMIDLNQQLDTGRKKLEELLLNILPKKVADELLAYGVSSPIKFDDISVMFTDFVGFTQAAEKLPAQAIVEELEVFFNEFDSVAETHHLEKLKTIGDSYMFAGGLPTPDKTHPIDCVLAGLEIQRLVASHRAERDKKGKPVWEMRLGVNTGPVAAGVIGKKKFAYDIWGDTVNLASRMESSGEPGKVNISLTTHERVKDFFVCGYRGKVFAKNKGEVDMYFVHGIRPELSENGAGLVPNGEFEKKYKLLEES